MTTVSPPGIPAADLVVSSPESPRRESSGFVKRAIRFVAIGCLLYVGLYAGAEWLVRETAYRNRFHVVQSAPHARYDYVILGASHAAVFDYRDMNARLEEMTGARILNLANVGAGITVNRFLLEYFLRRRQTGAVVYVLDSFAFYSPEWNEERLGDVNLIRRAPWDPRLARMLLTEPASRSAAIAYITGFAKINDRDRFAADLFPGEGSSFDRTYRPIPQLDRQRVEYLYRDLVTESSFEESPYLAQFENLVRQVRARGMRFIVIRPPIPTRIYDQIPHERRFDAVLQDLLGRIGAELYDFSRVANDPEYFYDSDHLNRTGVLHFFENRLRYVLETPPEV